MDTFKVSLLIRKYEYSVKRKFRINLVVHYYCNLKNVWEARVCFPIYYFGILQDFTPISRSSWLMSFACIFFFLIALIISCNFKIMLNVLTGIQVKPAVANRLAGQRQTRGWTFLRFPQWKMSQGRLANHIAGSGRDVSCYFILCTCCYYKHLSKVENWTRDRGTVMENRSSWDRRVFKQRSCLVAK